MGKKKHIAPNWKETFDTISPGDRKSLGITRSNYRVEFSKELDYVRKHR